MGIDYGTIVASTALWVAVGSTVFLLVLGVLLRGRRLTTAAHAEAVGALLTLDLSAMLLPASVAGFLFKVVPTDTVFRFHVTMFVVALLVYVVMVLRLEPAIERRQKRPNAWGGAIIGGDVGQRGTPWLLWGVSALLTAVVVIAHVLFYFGGMVS